MRDLVLLLRTCRPQWPGVKPQPPTHRKTDHVCTECGEGKKPSDFYPGRPRKDGTPTRRAVCKACEKRAVQERRHG